MADVQLPDHASEYLRNGSRPDYVRGGARTYLRFVEPAIGTALDEARVDDVLDSHFGGLGTLSWRGVLSIHDLFRLWEW